MIGEILRNDNDVINAAMQVAMRYHHLWSWASETFFLDKYIPPPIGDWISSLSRYSWTPNTQI